MRSGQILKAAAAPDPSGFGWGAGRTRPWQETGSRAGGRCQGWEMPGQSCAAGFRSSASRAQSRWRELVPLWCGCRAAAEFAPQVHQASHAIWRHGSADPHW